MSARIPKLGTRCSGWMAQAALIGYVNTGGRFAIHCGRARTLDRPIPAITWLYRGINSMKQLVRIAVVLMVVFATAPLHADTGGCINSPELPTALLGVVGFAGAGFSYLRQRARRSK